jgi:hypothetical protein
MRPVEVPEIVLTLTEDEAQSLKTIINCVSINSQGGTGYFAEDLWELLNENGIADKEMNMRVVPHSCPVFIEFREQI